ncbi:MAG TPA: FAD-dependent oxidoreductase, partial [Polyangia bacterium]
MTHNPILTDAQLKRELDRCEYCAEKPCKDGCPVDCSPADFIMAAKLMAAADIQRAAAEIMTANPLGGICGLTCPDRFCQARCSHARFDGPLEIPAIQATLVAKAKALGVMPRLTPAAATGPRVAVVGAGPAGFGAAVVLAQRGYQVEILERGAQAGGALHTIPEHRLPRDLVASDLAFTLALPNVTLKLGTEVRDPAALLAQGYAGVVVTTGLWQPIALGVPGEARAVAGLTYLADPAAVPMTGRVAVVGGGATAVDCAVTAKRRGADLVEMLALEKLSEMPLTQKELREVMEHAVQVSGRVRVTAILPGAGLRTI